MRPHVRTLGCAGLMTLASPLRCPAARRDYPRAIESLQEALSEVRRAAPLVAEPFLLVAEPAKSYGGYVPRRNAEFRRNEELHFYLEPKNLRTASGPSSSRPRAPCRTST